MPVIRPLIRRALAREEGFTLAEVLVAMVILSVALLGVGLAVATQSGGMAASFPVGQAAVTRGYYISAAIMLAQERLEDVTRLQYVLTPSPGVDGFCSGTPPCSGTGQTPPGFSTSSVSIGGISFSREVKVDHNTPATNMKTITVTVTFTLPKEFGSGQESVKLGTLVAARP